MVLVALAMVAIIAMAALSIDIITLYLAREEAQRSADVAALAAARVISISGITGTANPSTDTAYWTQICGGSSSAATQAAQAAAGQNAVGNLAGGVTVTYSSGSGSTFASSTNCSGLSAAFAVNPIVTVQVQRTALPTFFSRIWGNTGNAVSATAAAEAFNPSNSGTNGNQTSGTIIPVQPRCVKPWVVPNLDPLNPGSFTTGGPRGGTTYYCGQGTPPGVCRPFVSTVDGSIQNPGISLNGSGNPGVIGETFWLVPDCHHSSRSSCNLRAQPQPNYVESGSPYVQALPNLLYVPGLVGTTVTAIPSCTQGDPYEEAIEGCDSSANYSCGVQGSNINVVDATRNPAASGATTNGVQCLIQQQNANDLGGSSGQDYLTPFGAPAAYPFQITAGTQSALGQNDGLARKPVSSSASIVSLPIYNNTAATISSNTTTSVTFVGFLQVFINAVDQNGNVNVTVLNVAGCGGGNPAPGTAVTGSSPVPIRLITPP